MAILAVAGFWRLYRHAQLVTLKEYERRSRVARRQNERERAKDILANGAPPLTDVPIQLSRGEVAYYRTPASLLHAESDGGFRRAGRGDFLVTNHGAYFVEENGKIARHHRVVEIERIEIPYIDVIALVSFRDTINRDEERTYYQVPEPLVAAAHLARFTAFELILD